MDDELREFARRCYGYGNWRAPYWFIGPEQGQAREENDDLRPRIKAWHDLGKVELNDCCDFHALIGEKSWHREKPRLQSTWRPLMLLLMTFLEKSTDNDRLREYQRDQWGRLEGETCVIELSGLAAHSFKIPRDRELFRRERIEFIRERMLHCKPALAVMYGERDKPHWEAIAGQPFPAENILKIGSITVVFTPHPTTRGFVLPQLEMEKAFVR